MYLLFRITLRRSLSQCKARDKSCLVFLRRDQSNRKGLYSNDSDGRSGKMHFWRLRLKNSSYFSFLLYEGKQKKEKSYRECSQRKSSVVNILLNGQNQQIHMNYPFSAVIPFFKTNLYAPGTIVTNIFSCSAFHFFIINQRPHMLMFSNIKNRLSFILQNQVAKPAFRAYRLFGKKSNCNLFLKKINVLSQFSK